MDQVVTLIRSSKDKANAKERLVSELNFTEVQAEAILMLQLYRLTNLDVTTLVNEKKSLEEQIEDLEALLSSPTKMNNLINIFGEMISKGNRDIAINDIMNLLIQNANFTDEELTSLSVMLGFEE